MPSAKELEREITLGDGESVVVVIDPAKEIGTELRDGRTTWMFPMSVEGEPAVMKGGRRLKNAMLLAGLRRWERPTKVKITAKGAPRSFDRDYHAEVIT